MSLKLLCYHKGWPVHMRQGSMEIIFPDKLFWCKEFMVFSGWYFEGDVISGFFDAPILLLICIAFCGVSLLGCIWSWMIITMSPKKHVCPHSDCWVQSKSDFTASLRQLEKDEMSNLYSCIQCCIQCTACISGTFLSIGAGDMWGKCF